MIYNTSVVKSEDKPKRNRRTVEQLDVIKDDVKAILNEYTDRITIRHLFYRLVGNGTIQKTEDEYSKLCRQLAKWRKNGEIAYDNFVDGTRFYTGETLYGDMSSALDITAECYRKNLWATQPHFVEVWVEKDAITGIVSGIASSFGVKTFCCRGFTSITSLYNAAETYKKAIQHGKQVSIFYLGDHDPSGLGIDKQIKEAMYEFDIDITFTRLAILPPQIIDLNLPTRPVKATDRRAKDWEGGCVEIDTLRPAQLKTLLEDAIASRIDTGEWMRLKQIENEEKETLRQIAANWRN
jgi:hypothetical protein